MSFLSILRKIDTVIADVEKVAEPIIEIVWPVTRPALALFDRLQSAIATVEGVHTAPGSGAAKSQAVTQDFNSSLTLTQNMLAAQGKQLYYPPALLQAAIDAQVAAYNAMATLQAAMKIVPAA
jgi:hypothetical protein